MIFKLIIQILTITITEIFKNDKEKPLIDEDIQKKIVQIFTVNLKLNDNIQIKDLLNHLLNPNQNFLQLNNSQDMNSLKNFIKKKFQGYNETF